MKGGDRQPISSCGRVLVYGFDQIYGMINYSFNNNIDMSISISPSLFLREYGGVIESFCLCATGMLTKLYIRIASLSSFIISLLYIFSVRASE